MRPAVHHRACTHARRAAWWRTGAAPRIEHRRLQPRVGADEQDGVGLLDASHGGVGQVGAAHIRIQLRAAGVHSRAAAAQPVCHILRSSMAQSWDAPRLRARLPLPLHRCEDPCWLLISLSGIWTSVSIFRQCRKAMKCTRIYVDKALQHDGCDRLLSRPAARPWTPDPLGAPQ